MDNKIDILPEKRSRYNSDVFVDKCSKCGTTENLHTHHKVPQKNANKYGNIIEGELVFHKNVKCNLEILCEKCHQEEHHHKD